MSANESTIDVLLVEDEIDDVAIAQIALRRLQLDVRLEVVADGASALTRLAEDGAHLPDLVVLDLNLPKMNGLDVLGRAREALGPRCPPIVMLTSSNTPAERAEAARRGAAAFYTKPFHLDELQVLLRTIFTEHAPRRAPR